MVAFGLVCVIWTVDDGIEYREKLFCGGKMCLEIRLGVACAYESEGPITFTRNRVSVLPVMCYAIASDSRSLLPQPAAEALDGIASIVKVLAGGLEKVQCVTDLESGNDVEDVAIVERGFYFFRI